jgi:hypothetical protein
VDPGSNPDVRPEEEPGSLLALALLALIAGGAAGLCAAFRLALEEADRLRDRVIALAHGGGLAGFLLVAGGAGLAVADPIQIIWHGAFPPPMMKLKVPQAW